MRTHPLLTRASRAAVLLSTAALAVTVTGCGSSKATEPQAAPTPTPVEPVRIQDPWVKASDKDMTAAFGTLVNDTDTDVTITAASTEVSPMELHGMVMKDGKMVMQTLQGGLVVKAKTSHKLEPGSDHLMLMKLKRPIPAGEQLSFTLTFADGKTMSFTAVAKPFTGARESYDPGTSPTPATSGQPEPVPSRT
ncbi:hypothetical protein GCM10010124_11150 [Pilimelia terevasa]|uniref:Copper chaperone PCu(A)C n=1 Tax=Pilimelia terevasa TaxID=53372 RepID=A0A8J3FFA9_9ACTN|nr:copper chaperone PCu(A)C [Pilimelia terevasa]GGK20296.1 hypothetical protein GCM10010124_11150 [Pilimelia terevasa]